MLSHYDLYRTWNIVPVLAVGPCLPGYTYQSASANPKLPLLTSPAPFPLGNHKSILWESVSLWSVQFSRSVADSWRLYGL